MRRNVYGLALCAMLFALCSSPPRSSRRGLSDRVSILGQSSKESSSMLD